MKDILWNRPVLSWALADWANSAFATTVMAAFLPVFFKEYWSAGTDATVSTFRLGIGNGIAGAVVALIAPLLGSIADRGGTRVRLLFLFTLLGAGMTAALYWVERGGWPLALLFYGAATVGFSGGVALLDSLLVDVAERKDMHLVSSYGYSIGYLGGGLMLLLNAGMTLKPQMFGLTNAAQAVRVSFLTVAVWWVVFTVPSLLFIRERVPAAPLGFFAAASTGWRELWTTLRRIGAYRNAALFLLAYWLYIDGVNTVIKMAVDYGMALGLPSNTLIVALLVSQFVAFPSALLSGWFGARYGARPGILIAIGVYVLATVWASFLNSVADFYLMAIVIGTVQGGIQSLSRSFFGRLIPSERSGEFFGFFNMMGKFATILGPVMMGWVALATSSSRIAVLSITALFGIGGALLCFVRDPDQTPV